LKDDDVNCEYPVDADDEYVTERGFQPTLPGESTKLSSALALFRAARILSKVLEDVFPAKTSYELSMKKLSELSDELDAWNNSLAPHLRLQFAQDKPSTGTISSRSPLLSLTYHYIRALIQRPAVCASLGSRSSSSMMTLGSSCKHMVQIMQLLEERGMSFAFCLNKDELLVLSGFELLYQGLDLDPASKILKDNQKTIMRIIGMLDRSKAPCAPEFGRVARSFLPLMPSPPLPKPPCQSAPPKPVAMIPKDKTPPLSRHASDPTVPAVNVNPIAALPASTRKQLKAIASRFSVSSASKPPKFAAPVDNRRATVHNISLHPHGVATQSQPSLSPITSLANYDPRATSRSEPSRSPTNKYGRPASAIVRPSAPPAVPTQPRPQSQQLQQKQISTKPKPPPTKQKLPNLDFLSFGADAEAQPKIRASQIPIKAEPEPTDWEKLLGSLDNGTTNIYDACYGGQPVEALLDTTVASMQAPTAPTATPGNYPTWDADLWALCQTETNTSDASAFTHSNGNADSIFSLTSDEERKNSDDFTPGDWVSASSSSDNDVYKGICMPADLAQNDDLHLGNSWDAGLNL
jgi:hypothetical protein